ncbi:MAG: M23 family metallopeptidase [Proteobacteria bacterium]|nr:M23 family metallopeptidase [Pseudomonadota bacterium]
MTALQNRLITSLLLCIMFILASCSQKNPARIVNNSHALYDRHSPHNKNKYQDRSSKTFSGSASVTIVQGDTLYDIAKENGISMRDLINANNLSAPYILRIGDRLRLPGAKYHTVVAGDNLYYISRTYGLNINDLIAFNDLKKPYTIRVGDRLKIPNSASFKAETPRKTEAVYKKPKAFSGRDNGKFIWPIKGEVVSTFGHKSGGLYNDGINIKAAKGSEVKVVRDGVVAYVGSELKGYGNLVIVKHSNNWISAYAHLDTTKVKRGDKVAKGSSIATVGATGNVDYPQLYFGIRRGRDAVDPQKYL